MTQPDEYYPDTAINASTGFTAYSTYTQADWENQMRAGWLHRIQPLQWLIDNITDGLSKIPFVGPLIAQAIIGAEAVVEDLMPWFVDLRFLLGDPEGLGTGSPTVRPIENIPLLGGVVTFLEGVPLIGPLVETITGVADQGLTFLGVFFSDVWSLLGNPGGLGTGTPTLPSLNDIPIIGPAVTWVQDTIVDGLNSAFNPLAGPGQAAEQLVTNATNALQGLMPPIIDTGHGIGDIISDVVEDTGYGVATFVSGFQGAVGGPVAAIINTGTGVASSLAETLHQAAGAGVGLVNSGLAAVGNIVPALTAFYNAWSGGNTSNATVDAAAAAMAKQMAILAQNTANIAALNAAQESLVGGTNVTVYNISGTLPASFTDMGTINLTAGPGMIPSGLACYNLATATNDDMTVEAAYSTSYGNELRVLIARANSTFTSFVYAYHFNNVAQIGCVVGGTETILVSSTLMGDPPVGGTHRLECIGDVIAYTSPTGGTLDVTDSVVSQRGADYRNAGYAAGGYIPGSGWGDTLPDHLSMWSFYDVGATATLTAYVAANESTTSSSYTDLTTTTDAVITTIGPRGVALVLLSCNMYTTSWDGYMSFAMSGANTQSADDQYAYSVYAAGTEPNQIQAGMPLILTGLTPGVTTFKAKYRSPHSTSIAFSNRRISVIPL